jgi:hypothetical protein
MAASLSLTSEPAGVIATGDIGPDIAAANVLTTTIGAADTGPILTLGDLP